MVPDLEVSEPDMVVEWKRGEVGSELEGREERRLLSKALTKFNLTPIESLPLQTDLFGQCRFEFKCI